MSLGRAVALFVVLGLALALTGGEESKWKPVGTVGLISSSVPSGLEYQAVFCGGVLIGPGVAATAAHCLGTFDGTQLDLLVPASEQCEDLLRLPVKRVVFHDIRMDLAILTAESPVLQWAQVAHDDPERLKASTWSDVLRGDGRHCYPGLAELAALPLSACVDARQPVFSRADVLCAKGGGQDNTCFGDSGGPVYSAESGNLVGITLGGAGCGADALGLYLRAEEIARVAASYAEK